VRCWGANTDGQLGLQQTPALADYDVHSTPSVVALGVSASRVDVGQRVACALGPANALHCWGANDKKQLARRGEDGDPVLGPAAADLDGQSVVRTGEANDASFGVTRDGALLGWGVVWGREASVSPDAVPFALPSLTSVTRFAIGSMHACAIADGILHCWGRGDQGALGTGTPDLERFPVAVGIGGDRTSAYPQQLSVADRNTCVRTTDGTVACCGDDAKGQLGRGPGGAPSALFAKATVFTGEAVAVASSNATTCVLVQGGAVQCWGGNGAGELGQGSHDDEPHPSPITVAFP
jgi:alpha-tubulin suppressor-like RCC1 family protein